MNENFHTPGNSDVPWPTSNDRSLNSDSSMATGGDQAAPAAVLLKNAVQGAHNTLDRFADRAEPAMRQIGDKVASAEETLRVKTAQLRQTGDAWAEDARTTVRSNPLVWVVSAFALGALFARIAR